MRLQLKPLHIAILLAWLSPIAATQALTINAAAIGGKLTPMTSPTPTPVPSTPPTNVGSQGPQGPQGPQGLAGSQGSIGPAGPAGIGPTGTAVGDMQYWNGTSWVMLSKPSSDNKTLHFCGTAPSWEPCKTYKIGDKGPSGSNVVFYVDATGEHGLEEYPDNNQTSAGSTHVSWQTAMLLKNIGGRWRLPTRTELRLMYEQRDATFTNGCYWSSTSATSSWAWMVAFANGTEVANSNATLCNIRAVREF